LYSESGGAALADAGCRSPVTRRDKLSKYDVSEIWNELLRALLQTSPVCLNRRFYHSLTKEKLMSKTGNSQGRATSTTPTVASRVQGSVARSTGGAVPKGSYVGRLQGAAARNYGKSGGK
jgi:hypothetical protein